MCIVSNWVNEAQDLMAVTKYDDLPNSLIPSAWRPGRYLVHVTTRAFICRWPRDTKLTAIWLLITSLHSLLFNTLQFRYGHITDPM